MTSGSWFIRVLTFQWWHCVVCSTYSLGNLNSLKCSKLFTNKGMFTCWWCCTFDTFLSLSIWSICQHWKLGNSYKDFEYSVQLKTWASWTYDVFESALYFWRCDTILDTSYLASLEHAALKRSKCCCCYISFNTFNVWQVHKHRTS